jgi:hypothetical protein
MLRPNGQFFASFPIRFTGGSESILRSSWTKNEQLIAGFNGSPNSIPVGRRATAFALARSEGGVSCSVRGIASLVSDLGGTGDVSVQINGTATVTNAALTGFRFGEATITGTATIANAPLSGAANVGANIRIGFNPSAEDITGNLLDAQFVETGVSVRQALRLITAILAGKVSGAEGTTVTFRNVGDDKNRVVATVDSNGNRTTITYDLTT